MSEASDSFDDRPRPQFGEYATPEEQRARIRASDPTGSLEQRPDPAFTPPAMPGGVPTTGAGRPPSPRRTPSHVSPVSQLAPRRLADRIATFALLGYGLINVLVTVPGLFDFRTVADLYFQIAGVPGSFTNIGAGRTWGTVAAVVLLVGYAVTVWLSWRRLRRARLAWWIPIVGGVVTNLVVGVCILGPLMGDPAFQSYLTSMG